MKRIMIVITATLFAVTSFARGGEATPAQQNNEEQGVASYKGLIPGAIASRPENDPAGKTLTMDETILSRELSPQPKRYRWVPDGKSYIPEEIRRPEGPGMRPRPGFGGPAEGLQPAWRCVNEDNGLYLKYSDGTLAAIAEDSDRNIVYGQSVSRNEFGIDGGVFVSPDSTLIAFYRKDESRVTDFPLLNIKSRTGELETIKYPMAGMDSEVLRLCVYNVETRDTLHLRITDFGADRYLTNVTWSPDSRHIFIQVLDRTQEHCRLNMYEAATGEFVKTILTEDNEKYVEPLDPLYFLAGSSDRFIYRTANRDGYRNLYLCDTDGTISRLTATDADVAYADNDGRWVYYTSAEVSPIENHLFKVDTKTGKTVRLTEAEGWHNVSLSPDYKYFTDTYSSLCNPGTVELRTTDGKLIETLCQCEDPTLDWAYGEIILGTVKSADGLYDNYYRLVLPTNFDPTQKYPLILYVYGGPHSQMVNDSFLAQLRRWEMYMAQRGYILYIQDNRGTQNRGLEYEQTIHRQCGQAEMADQMVGINMMRDLPFVDGDRIGVHGWSYGGFMTVSLISNYPDVFKVAVAGGPVIDWQWYEVMYGERYMDTPQSNPDGFAKTSLINAAKNLRGKLLICQGAVDNTVVWQNSLSFVQECIDNGIQVDYFP
ncbi:MAG: S9 family peptidase, partial [Bacteroidales bacterium]|nr:S9 family peptidase [Bacteroidales bacterium]